MPAAEDEGSGQGRGQGGGPEAPGPDGPVVWIVDADHWPRVFLRAELIERGYDAVGFVTLGDAMAMLPFSRARHPRLAVIDLHGEGLDPEVLDILTRAGVRLVAIASATEEPDEPIRTFAWAAFLRRPLTVGQIADAIAKLS